MNLKHGNVEQSSSPATDGDEYSVEDVYDEFECLSLRKYMSPRDQNEVHFLPDQTGKSV